VSGSQHASNSVFAPAFSLCQCSPGLHRYFACGTVTWHVTQSPAWMTNMGTLLGQKFWQLAGLWLLDSLAMPSAAMGMQQMMTSYRATCLSAQSLPIGCRPAHSMASANQGPEVCASRVARCSFPGTHRSTQGRPSHRWHTHVAAQERAYQCVPGVAAGKRNCRPER
jgi:hypothetical protein